MFVVLAIIESIYLFGMTTACLFGIMTLTITLYGYIHCVWLRAFIGEIQVYDHLS